MTSLETYHSQQNDKITLAAKQLVQYLADKYEPMVQEAQHLMMDIPEDPSLIGLAEFNRLISVLRSRSNTVARYLMQATEEKRKSQRRRDAAKTAFEEKLQYVLSTDTVVLEIDGQQAKMAEARARLTDEARLVDYAGQIYTLVLGYHEALKLVHDQLSETSRDLMRQYSVIKQQIQMGEVDGGGWRPGAGGGEPGNPRAELEAKLASELGDAGHSAI